LAQGASCAGMAVCCVGQDELTPRTYTRAYIHVPAPAEERTREETTPPLARYERVRTLTEASRESIEDFLLPSRKKGCDLPDSSEPPRFESGARPLLESGARPLSKRRRPPKLNIPNVDSSTSVSSMISSTFSTVSSAEIDEENVPTVRPRAFSLHTAGSAPPGTAGAPWDGLAPTDDCCGEIVGGYVLGRTIGQGSCSRVYAAHGPAGTVALKRMFRGSQEFEDVLTREFQMLQSLHHPSIIRALEMGSCQGAGWMAMELFDGVTLTKAVESQRVPPTVACLVLRPVASAAAYLHGLEICHRDLKPDNVLVSHSGALDVRLIDFNVAAHGRSGFLSPVGALPFVAPEVRGVSPYDSQADVWGLGAIGYFLVAGKFPQPRKRFREQVWLEGLPAVLRPLVAACLEDEPPARPRADAVVTRLDEAEETETAKQ